MLHAPGQGALGLEVSIGDEQTLKSPEALSHRPTSLTCIAEKSLLKTLEGACSAPFATSPSWDELGEALDLSATVISPDGKAMVASSICGTVSELEDAEHLGNDLARHTRSPPPMIRRPDLVLFHALITKRKEFGYCSMVVSRRLRPCSLPGMCWNIALVLLMLVRPGQVLHDRVPAMVLAGRKYRDPKAGTSTRVVKGGINIEAIR